MRHRGRGRESERRRIYSYARTIICIQLNRVLPFRVYFINFQQQSRMKSVSLFCHILSSRTHHPPPPPPPPSALFVLFVLSRCHAGKLKWQRARVWEPKKRGKIPRALNRTKKSTACGTRIRRSVITFIWRYKFCRFHFGRKTLNFLLAEERLHGVRAEQNLLCMAMLVTSIFVIEQRSIRTARGNMRRLYSV